MTIIEEVVPEIHLHTAKYGNDQRFAVDKHLQRVETLLKGALLESKNREAAIDVAPGDKWFQKCMNEHAVAMTTYDNVMYLAVYTPEHDIAGKDGSFYSPRVYRLAGMTSGGK